MKQSSIKKAIGNLEHGNRLKNVQVKKMLQVSPMEKIMGITMPQKIQQLKRLSPMFGSKNRREFLFGIEEFIGELFVSALNKKKNGKSVDYEFARLTRLGLELFDRLYGKPVDTMINVQNNIDFDARKHFESFMSKLSSLEAEQELKPERKEEDEGVVIDV